MINCLISLEKYHVRINLTHCVNGCLYIHVNVKNRLYFERTNMYEIILAN